MCSTSIQSGNEEQGGYGRTAVIDWGDGAWSECLHRQRSDVSGLGIILEEQPFDDAQDITITTLLPLFPVLI